MRFNHAATLEIDRPAKTHPNSLYAMLVQYAGNDGGELPQDAGTSGLPVNRQANKLPQATVGVGHADLKLRSADFDAEKHLLQKFFPTRNLRPDVFR